MCSNAGKFVDRNPNIRAAGITPPCDEHIGESLKEYSKFELAEAWLKKRKCTKAPPTIERFPTSPCLSSDQVHEVLTPELQKSRFAKFREQFFEDLHLKKPELGKARQVHSTPEDVNNESRTFGQKTEGFESLYELILPRKSAAQVNEEYIKWHSKYLISHKHYLPGEQINRSYNENFKRNTKFGKATNVDATGRSVKRCLKQRDQVVLVKGLQKYYLDKEFGDDGGRAHKFNDPHINDPQKVFGILTEQDKCKAQDIMYNISPCEENNELIDAIAYLHQQRYKLHSNPHLDIYELEVALHRQDPENTGYLSLKQALEVSRYHFVYLNEHKMRLSLSFFKLLLDVGQPTERIFIDDFSKALQSRYLLPNIPNRTARSTVQHDMDTVYRQLCRDREKPAPPGVVYRKVQVDDAEDSIGPEAFDELRDKSQLQRIFADIVNQSTFEQLWTEAQQKSKMKIDRISINDFRAVLKELRAQQEPAYKHI